MLFRVLNVNLYQLVGSSISIKATEQLFKIFFNSGFENAWSCEIAWGSVSSLSSLEYRAPRVEVTYLDCG